MKTTLKNIAMTIGLTAVLGSATLLAQSNLSTAHIPFDFQVAGMTLPAGDYNVKIAGDTKVLTFQNRGNGDSIMLLTVPVSGKLAEEPRLTFLYDGERYTMKTAWFAGMSGGYSTPKSKGNRAEGERGIVATVRLLQK
jgi:hypothetical protein